jgi:hypothetical protein
VLIVLLFLQSADYTLFFHRLFPLSLFDMFSKKRCQQAATEFGHDFVK